MKSYEQAIISAQCINGCSSKPVELSLSADSFKPEMELPCRVCGPRSGGRPTPHACKIISTKMIFANSP